MPRAKVEKSEKKAENPVEEAPAAPPTLFSGIVEVPEAAIVPLERPDDGIQPLDGDLTPSEKEEFVRLLNREIKLDERARRLAGLARLKGSKTAGVGLRALQEINAITGISKDGAKDAPPIFALPAGTSVSVTVKKSDV